MSFYLFIRFKKVHKKEKINKKRPPMTHFVSAITSSTTNKPYLGLWEGQIASLFFCNKY